MSQIENEYNENKERTHNISGHVGIRYANNKWLACRIIRSSTIISKYFDTIKEAVMAMNEANIFLSNIYYLKLGYFLSI